MVIYPGYWNFSFSPFHSHQTQQSPHSFSLLMADKDKDEEFHLQAKEPHGGLASEVEWIDNTGYLDLIRFPEKYTTSDMASNFTEGCKITIVRVEGLSPPAPRPYLVVYASGSDTTRPFLKWGTHTSTHTEESLNPVFNIFLPIPQSELPIPPEPAFLVVQLWDHHTLLADEMVGQCVIPLERPMQKTKERYDLTPPSRGILSALTPMSHKPPPKAVCGNVVMDIEIPSEPKWM